MKIVVLDGITETPDEFCWEGLEKLGELKVYERASLTDPKEAVTRIGEAEAVFINKTPLSAEVINACPVRMWLICNLCNLLFFFKIQVHF
jgi:glycerate dehydrogenase